MYFVSNIKYNSSIKYLKRKQTPWSYDVHVCKFITGDPINTIVITCIACYYMYCNIAHQWTLDFVDQ